MNDAAKALFHELADLSPAERERYLAQREVPAGVRAEVESLLDFSETSNGFFEASIAAAADTFFSSEPIAQSQLRCGPYLVGRLLGRGGMGAVYLAQRDDGEVDQRVAIKFLRFGAESPAFLARFLKERQILASLSHPGIARLVDAGHTDGGQPYLVMEYVDGTPIDVYTAGLELQATLSLFLHVADAVSYAHRNLVIHRDLKPSNILIDATGQPKLLDFGIAKMLDDGDTTRTVERLLTPDFASPEQVRGQAQSTSTDVYSLGAVLYKLLTGKAPRTSDDVWAITSGAHSSITLPSRINKALPRDIDFILNKALRAEPEERYVSVDAFADDIRAFLEHRPVRARKGSAWYRTRKFVRRAWLPVTATALAVVSLCAGLLVANRERSIAQRRFQQVRQLSNELLALDTDIRRLPGATQARHRLVSTSLSYLERLGAEAHDDVDLALEIGSGYMWVAKAQGVPTDNNLGQHQEAEKSLVKAQAFIDTVLRAQPGNRVALLRSAEILNDRSIIADTAERDDDVVSFARSAAQRLDSLLASGKSDTAESLVAARLFGNIALGHQNNHKLDDAMRYARRCVELVRPFDQARSQQSACLSVLANSMRFSGDVEGALTTIRQARNVIEQARDVTVPNLFAVMWREGVILGEDDSISLGRPQEAATILRKAFDLMEDAARKDAKDYSSRSRLSMAARELGDVLRRSDPRAALDAYDHGYRRLDEVSSPKSRRDQIWLLAGSSYALRDLGRTDEARARIDAAFAAVREVKEYPADRVQPGSYLAALLRASGDHQAETRDLKQAIATYEDLLAKVLASKPQPEADLRHASDLSRIYLRLAELYLQNQDTGKAREVRDRNAALWQHWDRKLPANPFVQRQIASTNTR